MKTTKFSKLAIISVAFIMIFAMRSSAAIQTYQATHMDTIAPEFIMTVGGVAVRINRLMAGGTGGGIGYDHTHYARFGMSGTNTVSITATSNWSGVKIHPAAYGISVNGIGTNAITFDLPENKPVIIESNQAPICLFSRLPESNPPQAGDANVKNVMDFLSASDTTGTATITSKLQSAIDWVAANYQTKPILYFPNGVYKSGKLKMKSNVQMYLQGGACIKNTNKENDYPLTDLSVDGDNQSMIIQLDTLTGFKIFGRGIIDGTQTEHDFHNVMSLYQRDCRQSMIEGIMIRNTNHYNMYMLRCHDCKVKDVDLIGARKFGNGDGIIISHGSNDTVQGLVDYVGGDDGYSVGVRFSDPDGCHDILFENGLLYQSYTGLRISLCTAGPVYNITFRNMHLWNAGNVYCFPGGWWYSCDQPDGDIYNIRFERITSEGGGLLEMNREEAQNTVRDIDIIDCEHSDFENAGEINGQDASHKVSNVTFHNFKLNGVVVTNANEAGISIGLNTSNIIFTTGATSISAIRPGAGYPAEAVSGGEKYTVQIIDIRGRSAATTQGSRRGPGFQKTDSFAPGVYFLFQKANRGYLRVPVIK